MSQQISQLVVDLIIGCNTSGHTVTTMS